MNVIIVAKFLKTPRKLNFRDPRVLAVSAAALALLLGLGLVGGYLARGANVAAVAEVRQMRETVERQQRELDEARAEAERELNALATRMAELQASATRLNALGQRLTRLGKIEEGEFDFNEPPALGGPEGTEPAAVAASLSVFDSMAALEQQFEWQSEQFDLLESLMLDQDVDRSLTPAGMPVRVGYAASPFGYRTDPFTGKRAFHAGMDFSGPRGSEVMAVADGVVSFVGRRSGYGNMVEIDHGNGYVTRYGHNDRNVAKAGQRVHAGQVIARMGSTGRSTGSHVHFEVLLNDRPVNPRQYLDATARG